MNGNPIEGTLLNRIRSLRVETSALLTAVKATRGAGSPPLYDPDIPREWLPQYHRQVQEKLAILGQGSTKIRNC